jgi:hypothetical protein
MLVDGDVVILRCEGHLEGNRFLDGRTLDGTVGLAPNTAVPPFTGTLWWTRSDTHGNFFLQCLGHVGQELAAKRFRFLDGRTRDGTVGLAPNTDFPFTGTTWQVIGILSNFTFADDISDQNRAKLIDRHKNAVGEAGDCVSGLPHLTAEEKLKLFQTYQRPIHHITNNEPGINARTTVGGSEIQINFGMLFPQGDAEISQTLIHEMMHSQASPTPPSVILPPDPAAPRPTLRSLTVPATMVPTLARPLCGRSGASWAPRMSSGVPRMS